MINTKIEKVKAKNGRKTGTSQVKFWSKKSIVYIIISGLIAILLSFVPEITTKEIIWIFIGTLVAFIIVDYFVFYLPKKLGLDD